MLNILPAPTHHQHINHRSSFSTQAAHNVQTVATTGPPPYGRRQGWKPQRVADYGDGGAFPEIAIQQFPLNMGRKGENTQQGNVTSLQVDAQGNTRYDAVITQNHRRDQKVYTSHTDLMAVDDVDEESLVRPSEKEIRETTEETRKALEKLGEAKIAAARPRNAAHKQESSGPLYIRYTPGQQNERHNSGAKSRIIRLHEMPVDPLEPPKFRHKKVPNGPPSPPVPVMHSPPRKITVQDQMNWKIPPCISNWKNIKGYTIPLDKRIAADGRNLKEKTVNDKFCRLSDALFVSERKARQEVEQRAVARRRLAQRKKASDAQNLADMAGKIRQKTRTDSISDRAADNYDETETKDEAEARLQRNQFRSELDRDRIRKLRQEDKARRRKGASERNATRDEAEKRALGLGTAKSGGGEALYDQRLFNQSQGMDSGFGADDAYTTYDKQLFKGGSSSMLFKPSNVDNDTYGGDADKLIERATSRFKANTEFDGVEDARRSRKGGSRNTLVEFEREKDNNKEREREREKDDEFGLARIFDTDRTESRRPSSALDDIGKSNNSMSGAAGSSRHSALGRSGRKMEFTESETSSKRNTREELRSRRLREKEEREKSRRERETSERKDSSSSSRSKRRSDRSERDSRRDRDRDDDRRGRRRDRSRSRSRDRDRRSRRKR